MRWAVLTVFIFGLVHASQQMVGRSQTIALENRIVLGLTDFMLTGYESDELKEAFELLKAPFVFRAYDAQPSSPKVCTLCNVAARILLSYRKHGASTEKLSAAIKKLCINAKIESETVCNGVIDLNIGIFLFIVDNKPDLTPEKICSIIAQPSGCTVSSSEDDWSVSVPSPLQNPPAPRRELRDEKPVRILHLTDIHFDDIYAPGANALCGEPLCCGTNQGEPANASAMAGNWGDYRSCDMPWYSVVQLMDQIKTHDIDYLYYTGDIINHRVWATSIESNVKNIKKIYDLIKENIKVPVFPILGNHEPNPLNEFAPDNITDPQLTTQWLYDTVADEWSHWLPSSTQETIKKGGYYTVLVRPGFRIVALNSNVGYTFNWWLIYEDEFLKDQLQWLTNTLLQAEKDGEIVHILSHVPTGDSTCLRKWSREYNRIIQRFAHVIAAQFVGHTHYDEMNLFFNDSNTMQPISAVFNGGSFTTFINVNPNYVLYEINPVTMEVEDYDEWIYNVTEANKYSVDVPPKWFKLYSFKEAYGLKSMKLDELGKLVREMARNQTLLDTYYRFKMRDGDLAMEQGCDQTCHETNLCNLVTTQFNETKICDELLTEYRKSNEIKKLRD